jgi:hypothetical protein
MKFAQQNRNTAASYKNSTFKTYRSIFLTNVEILLNQKKNNYKIDFGFKKFSLNDNSSFTNLQSDWVGTKNGGLHHQNMLMMVIREHLLILI